MRKLDFILIILLNGIACFLNAQEQQNKNLKWSAGYTTGATNIMSSINLNDNTWNKQLDQNHHLFFGLNVDRKINELVSLEGEWINGKLTGLVNDQLSSQQTPYRTQYNQLGISGLINFNNLLSKTNPNRVWYLYGKAGASMAFLDGKLDRTIMNHTSFVVPVGLGVNFRLNNNLYLGVLSTVAIGNDWLNSSVEKGTSGNTYWETFQNIGIKLSYRLGGIRKNSDDLVAEEETNFNLLDSSVVKATLNVDALKELQLKDEYSGMISHNDDTLSEEDELEIKMDSNENKTIVAHKDWQIKNGRVLAELPINNVIYRVQVVATYERMNSEKDYIRHLGVEGPLWEYSSIIDGKCLYKYAIAKDFDSFQAAASYSSKLNKKCRYKDTFVIAFKNGLRIE